jgi:hypothetical protein
MTFAAVAFGVFRSGLHGTLRVLRNHRGKTPKATAAKVITTEAASR